MTGIFGKNPGSVSYQGRLMILFAFIIGICLVGVLSSDGADAADGDSFEDENFVYQIISETNRTVKITDYIDSPTELTIPSKVTNGSVQYSVISIGDWAFYRCSSLTSVTILDSVKSIGDRAFCLCSALISVTISDGVTSIGEGAFEGCDSLTSITIPDSVTSIGDYAFYGCSALTGIDVSDDNLEYMSDDEGVLFTKDGEVLIQCPGGKSGLYEIPSGVESIGDYAFCRCSALISITIPDSVTSIGESAFEGCDSLTSITIPSGVESIGTCAFYECSALTSITISDSVTSIGDYAFYGCSALTGIDVSDDNLEYMSDDEGVLFTKNGKVLIQCPGGKSGSYEIPSGVESIGDYAFCGCSALTLVTIPDSVTSIEISAFEGCSALTSITIPSGVTSIGDYAFYGCSALTGIDVSDDNLEYMSDDEGVLFTKNGKVLIQCPGGKSGSYDIPSGVESIGVYAFYGCSALISITIPDSVTSIGYFAFYDCSALTSITIPKSVTSIGNYAFDGCIALVEFDVSDDNPNYTSDDEGILFNKNGTSLIKYPGGKSGTYTIPSGVTIKDHAFYGCVKLTAIHVEDNDLYSSNSGVLFNKDGTELICYPGGKEGPYTIPANVIEINDYAFWYCYGLTSLTVNWSNEYGIYDIMCHECPNVTEIKVLGNDILQSIDGSIYRVHENGLSLIRCPEGKTSLVLPESVVSISSEAVSSCHGLKEIVIKEGDSLDINRYAFMQSNSDIIFKSGKDGFDLKAYVDESKTNEITGAMLNSGWGGTLHFDWIPISEGPSDNPSDEPSGGINIGIVIGGIVAVIAVAGAGVFLFMRSRP